MLFVLVVNAYNIVAFKLMAWTEGHWNCCVRSL
ncbi:hypothetical protein SBDP2_450006 [Syntrophobacter sp. SbD2]|nr:hypothetical protein SBDP2_450006 [Syntrophobacter sp. SbD2]